MKKHLIIRLLSLTSIIALTLSCEPEQNEDITSSDLLLTPKQIDDTSSSDSKKRLCGGFGGSNNLDLCSTNFYMPAITTTSQWNIGDNGSNYIDYKLEENFAYHCSFSYTCLRPCGPVVETVYGEVNFNESPSFNPDTFEQDLFSYLPYQDITPEKATELQQDLACKIRDYQLANYPTFFVSEVDIIGDALLCNTSGVSSHYLRAQFKLTRHECL